MFKTVLKDLPQEQSNQIFKQVMTSTPQKLIKWREEIIEVVVEGPKWNCKNCTLQFEEGKQAKFEKMDLPFCSMKCISAFRQKGGFN